MVTLTNSELRALGNIQKYCKDTYLVKKAGVLLGVYAQVSLSSLSLMFNLHERTIFNYIDSYLDNGLETYLTPSQQGGARSRLSVEQAETVKTAIEEEPPIAAMVVFEAVFVETVKKTPQKYKFPPVLPNFVFGLGREKIV